MTSCAGDVNSGVVGDASKTQERVEDLHASFMVRALGYTFHGWMYAPPLAAPRTAAAIIGSGGNFFGTFWNS